MESSPFMLILQSVFLCCCSCCFAWCIVRKVHPGVSMLSAVSDVKQLCGCRDAEPSVLDREVTVIWLQQKRLHMAEQQQAQKICDCWTLLLIFIDLYTNKKELEQIICMNWVQPAKTAQKIPQYLMPLLLQHGTCKNMKRERVSQKETGEKEPPMWRGIAFNVTTYGSYFDIDTNKMLKKLGLQYDQGKAE